MKEFEGQQLNRTREILRRFQAPRYTTTEISELNEPRVGMIVYDSTINKLKVYTGSSWETITSS